MAISPYTVLHECAARDGVAAAGTPRPWAVRRRTDIWAALQCTRQRTWNCTGATNKCRRRTSSGADLHDWREVLENVEGALIGYGPGVLFAQRGSLFRSLLPEHLPAILQHGNAIELPCVCEQCA